jgi:hypothetical protein
MAVGETGGMAGTTPAGGTSPTAGTSSAPVCQHTLCGDACVDLASDPAHCNGCGNACPQGQVCSLGNCQTGCGAGLTQCGGACVNTTNDSSHCGSCQAACGVGRICGDGTCRCPTGQTDCGGQCADLNISKAHCGMCGTACGELQTCSAGMCSCATGQTVCGETCIDTGSFQTDRENCGRCGNPCATGQICSAGQCVASGSGGSCPSTVTVNANPLGCEVAWGANGNAGSRTQYLDFVTTWVGDENNGGLNNECSDCSLVRTVAGTNARVGYYAYFIGFQASKQAGYGDCNTDGDGQTLCTRGGQWIKDHRSSIVQMYANYARMTHEASPNKGVLWLLEGDFIQYTRSSQSSPLSLSEAGQLTADIICAIKANQPTASVGMNHSAWNTNEETDAFWRAMPLSIMDFVWTTGAGDANGFITEGTTASSYNGATAKYSYVRDLTGKRIFVDTSFGPSQQADSWSDQSASTLNQRIAEGIFAINITDPPADSTYQGRISALGALASTCN